MQQVMTNNTCGNYNIIKEYKYNHHGIICYLSHSYFLAIEEYKYKQ